MKLLSVRSNYALRDPAKLIAFTLISRLLLILIGSISVFVVINKNPSIDMPFDSRFLSGLRSAFHSADVNYYLDIAKEGYSRESFSMAQQKNWAFYPLWPILIRFGAAIFHSSAFQSGIILSNLLFLGGIILLYRLLLIDYKPSIAYLASTLIVIYPSSYFFSRPGPESLFFFLTILAFLAAKERRWAMAGITAGLATVTRMQGIILIVPLLLVYYKQYRRTKHHDWRILWLFCVPMATIGFMVYLYALTGNIWANFEIQSAWDSKLSVPFLSTIRYFINPLVISYYGWDLSLASFVFIVLSTLLSAYMFVARGFPSEYTAYAVLNLLVIVSRNNIQAAMRFLLPVFPFFLAIAILIQGRRLWNDLVLFFLTSLQAAYFIAYVNQYNFAHT